MNKKLKSAMTKVIDDILALSPEELDAELEKAKDGDIYKFFMEHGVDNPTGRSND